VFEVEQLCQRSQSILLVSEMQRDLPTEKQQGKEKMSVTDNCVTAPYYVEKK